MCLENEYLRIELDADTGGFRSIYDKKHDHEYVGAPDRAVLLRLMTPAEDADCRHLDGANATVSISGHTATVAYAWDGLEAVATLELDGPAVLARLRISNGGPHTVEEVIFPWVRGLTPFPDACLVWPNFWLRKVEDPFGKGLGGDHRTWNEWPQKLVARYPSHLASAWCDYGAADHGLAIEGRHTDFAIMDFFVHKVVEKDRDPRNRIAPPSAPRPSAGISSS